MADIAWHRELCTSYSKGTKMNSLAYRFSVASAAISISLCFPSLIHATNGDIKIGTYNIRYESGDRGTPNAWPERKADLVGFLHKLDLDAFGLQEVCPGQAAYITNNLPEYALVGEHRNADRVSGEASPVLYRKSRFEAIKCGTFWLSETPDTPGLKGWGAACPRVCSWMWLRDKLTGKTLCFANAHTDHISALARKEGMLLIIRRMREFASPGTPIIFTGDHNCTETEAPALAVSKLLKNALYISETAPTGPWRTFSDWKWLNPEHTVADALELNPKDREMEPYGPRIDYIYVSDGVKVKSYATRADARPGTKLYPSDHFPITAVIELK